MSRMKPNTHNLTSWVKGNNLNVFQKADAIIEYDNLLEYVSKLEKALNIIKNFDEDDEDKYGDPGIVAREALCHE